MDNRSIDMVKAVLEALPHKGYNPIVMVDPTGSVVNKIVKEHFDNCDKRSCAVELNEIIDVNDIANRQWLLETKPILIIYNIEKFVSGAEWQLRFFDLMNFTHENDINVMITSSVPIYELLVEGRVYARLNWGIMIELDDEI